MFVILELEHKGYVCKIGEREALPYYLTAVALEQKFEEIHRSGNGADWRYFRPR